MKYKWLAIAISAALPAVSLAQQDAKDNGNKDEAAQIKAKADSDKAQGEIAMKEAKQAIEAQAADAQAYNRALVKMRDQRQIKAAWLGLSASQAAPALRRQLKLADGTGLVIDFIQPDSPAAKAGLRQYDLLTKLSGQLLINPEQLSVLVRTFKPGNKVHVEFLREGEHQSVDAELVEHDMPPLADETGVSPFQFQPQSLEGYRTREDGARTGGGGFGGGGGIGWVKPGSADGKDQAVERRTLTLVDGKRQFSVDVSDDGHRVLNVVDGGSGRVMNKYPIDNDDQIRALPGDVRQAVNKLLPLLDGKKSDGVAGKNKANPAKNGSDGKPEEQASITNAKPGF